MQMFGKRGGAIGIGDRGERFARRMVGRQIAGRLCSAAPMMRMRVFICDRRTCLPGIRMTCMSSVRRMILRGIGLGSGLVPMLGVRVICIRVRRGGCRSGGPASMRVMRVRRDCVGARRGCRFRRLAVMCVRIGCHWFCGLRNVRSRRRWARLCRLLGRLRGRRMMPMVMRALLGMCAADRRT